MNNSIRFAQYTFLSFFVLTLISCSSKSDNEFKNLKVEYIETIKLSELIEPEYSHIPLNMHKSEIGEITKILFTDSLMYVLDRRFSKKVFVFDLDGGYKFTIGVLGAGIGEYADPRDIVINNNELHLSDNTNFSILKYSLEGEFIEEIKNGLWVGEIVSLDNQLVVYSPTKGAPNPDFGYNVLRVMSSDYKNLKTSFFPYHDVLENVCFPGQIKVFNNRVNFLKSYKGEAWILKDNLIVPRFKFDFGKYNWSVPLEELAIDEEQFLLSFINNDVMSVLHDVNETTNYFIFKTYMTKANSVAEEDEWLLIHKKGTDVCYAIHNIVNDINDDIFKFPLTTLGEELISVMPTKNNPVLMKYRLKEKMNLGKYLNQ